MPYYKAPDNSLHFIEPEFAHLLPAGSAPITDEEAEALRTTKPTHAELVDAILKQARADRAPILSVLDGLQASALVNGDQHKAQQIEVAKQGLRDITSIDLSMYATYEEMRLAIKARYAQLVAAAPEDVRLAFKQVAG